MMAIVITLFIIALYIGNDMMMGSVGFVGVYAITLVFRQAYLKQMIDRYVDNEEYRKFLGLK